MPGSTPLSTMCADGSGAHARAGMLYCNLPHLQAKQGERVRLYLMSLGTEDGIHAPGIASSNLDWDVRPPAPASRGSAVIWHSAVI